MRIPSVRHRKVLGGSSKAASAKGKPALVEDASPTPHMPPLLRPSRSCMRLFGKGRYFFAFLMDWIACEMDMCWYWTL